MSNFRYSFFIPGNTCFGNFSAKIFSEKVLCEYVSTNKYLYNLIDYWCFLFCIVNKKCQNKKNYKKMKK